jgi:hypothetical protein
MGQWWYTVAAGPNLRLADWLARTLEAEGQRAARAIPHDELLATGGELAVRMAHNLSAPGVTRRAIMIPVER